MSKSSEAVKKWRKATKQRIIDAMGKQCQCCGYNRCNECLDLHHLDPNEKELSFGAIRANPIAWSKIVEELRKCILVCRNCHGEIHNNNLPIPNNYCKFDESYSEYKIVSEELASKCPKCGDQKLTIHKFCSQNCAKRGRKLAIQVGAAPT